MISKDKMVPRALKTMEILEKHGVCCEGAVDVDSSVRQAEWSHIETLENHRE